jgi:hypothetical protein
MGDGHTEGTIAMKKHKITHSKEKYGNSTNVPDVQMALIPNYSPISEKYATA